jgi:hypothetical protein
MSPRRSSRARSSAHPPPASHTASSTSSTTLKNNNTLQRSVSAEDIDDQDDEKTAETIMPRRSRRTGADESRDASQSSKPNDAFDRQRMVEEEGEEVTRCICGETDYPGPSNHLLNARGLLGKSPEYGEISRSHVLTNLYSRRHTAIQTKRRGRLLRPVRQMSRLATRWLRRLRTRRGATGRVLLRNMQA